MSGVLGVAGGRPVAAPVVSAMLDRLAGAGGGSAVIEVVAGMLLAVRQADWRDGLAGAARSRIARRGAVAVAADATLYYRDDLLHALRQAGVDVTGDDAGELIAAAYEAWGTDAVQRLEGDFAFILWDGAAGLLLAARDLCGKRPLYYGAIPDGVVAASDASAVAHHPAVSADWNVVALAEDAAGMTGSVHETAYLGVNRLAPGERLVWTAAAGPRVDRFWQPPVFLDHARASSDGAEQLLELVTRAVAERLDADRPTVVWLSGGADSPAVYAAARRHLALHPESPPLRSVSISYPEGDPGREDELIEAVCAHWAAEPRFVDSRRIPLMDRAVERAARRTEPFPHPFELINTALALETRRIGARVALDGGGGDQLFQVSSIYLADLFASLRWFLLLREWRARGLGYRRMFKLAVQPTLPPAALRLAAWLRGGRPLASTDDARVPPPWIRHDFTRRAGLDERERLHLASPPGLSRAARESYQYFTLPIFGKMAQYLGQFAAAQGVEHRSPLYDRRLVEFAASRPVLERRGHGQTKLLLRRAMRGLLPDHVLAPRPVRTGVTIGYLVRGIRAGLGPLLDECLREPRLADLGVLEPALARSAWHEFLRTGDRHIAVGLFVLLETELWLRTHEDRFINRGSAATLRGARTHASAQSTA